MGVYEPVTPVSLPLVHYLPEFLYSFLIVGMVLNVIMLWFDSRISDDEESLLKLGT